MEEKIKNKLEEYYKKAKKIPYSTKVYGEKEDEIKPKFILRPLKFEDNKMNKDKKNNGKTLLIFKYKTLEGIPIEVIMGSVDATYDRKTKVEKVIELIEEQLRDNAKETEGYDYYNQILKYKKDSQMPLKFTLEGLQILSSKNPKEDSIERTSFINDKDRVEKVFTDEELEEYKKKNIPEVVKYQLWQEGREVILKGLKTNKDRQAFLKGEKIAQTMKGIEFSKEDTEKKIEEKNKNKKQFVTNYLLDIYDSKNTDESSDYKKIEDNIQELKQKVDATINSKSIDQRMRAKLELLKGQLELINKKDSEYVPNVKQQGENEDELLNEYIKIKEKGIASDINKSLEGLEEKLTTEIQKKIDEQRENKETEIKDYAQVRLLQGYEHFFNLVKNGMDRTARFYAINEEKINFDVLEKLFVKYNEKEMLEYIQLKQEMLKETNTEDIKNKEQEYPGIRNLYEFLLNSSVRERTKEDDENMFLKVFDKAKRKMLENNKDEINLYNSYAKRFKIYECPTYQKDKDNTKNAIDSTSLENLSEEGRE